MSAAFTVRHFFDLVVALEEHPEWRQELRRLLLTDDVLTLPQAVRELTEAQKRTEIALTELAEAQKRTEARVEELAEAQKRAEERLTRLEVAVAELAEAQKRAEERLTRLEVAVAELAEAQKRAEERLTRLEVAVAELAEAQKRAEERLTRLEVAVAELAEAQKRAEQRLSNVEDRLGRLERIVGVTVEEEAADVLRVVMEEKGYRVREEPVYWRPDGEADVILPVEDPEGRPLHVVLEAKVRLGRRAVVDWANRMRSEGFRALLARAGFNGPYLIYVYGMRADTSAEHAAQTFGIGLLTPRGEKIPPSGPE
jgi:DNA repair ATPase RecN